MFAFPENQTTFYRDIKKADGTDFVVRLPQYWAERPVTARKRVSIDSNGVRKESPIDYIMEIPLSNEIVAVFTELRQTIMTTVPGTTAWDPVVYPGTKTPGPVIVLGHESISKAKYYHPDGTSTPHPYTGEMDGGCHVLLDLHVSGFLVVNGVVKVATHIHRCVFVKADKNARIKLEFPGQLPAIPAHFLAMFNQLKPEDRTCPICMDVIEKDVAMTKCFHFFHGACIQKCNAPICPVCRCAF